MNEPKPKPEMFVCDEGMGLTRDEYRRLQVRLVRAWAGRVPPCVQTVAASPETAKFYTDRRLWKS